MSSRASALFVVAALLILAAFVLPIWSVYLEAPQYPEGLGMHIRASTITGLKPNDLDNINNLNHYIGMKRIVPESIPELRLMPFILAALSGLGLLTALLRKRWLARTWVGLFLAISVVGLVDFYRWEYDYGHNLDTENAIIKIPGMNYQPPLIGSKQLLNFRATSLPGAGGICLMAALGLGIVALVVDRRPRAAESPVRAGAPIGPALLT